MCCRGKQSPHLNDVRTMTGVQAALHDGLGDPMDLSTRVHRARRLVEVDSTTQIAPCGVDFNSPMVEVRGAHFSVTERLWDRLGKRPANGRAAAVPLLKAAIDRVVTNFCLFFSHHFSHHFVRPPFRRQPEGDVPPQSNDPSL